MIEALVALAIVVILAAFLIPTVLNARRQAQTTRCAANLRQLVAACLLRAQDSGGYLPLAGEIVLPPADVGSLAASLNDPLRRRYRYAPLPGGSATEMILPLPAAIAPYLGVAATGDDALRWPGVDPAVVSGTGAVGQLFACPGASSDASSTADTDDAVGLTRAVASLLAVKRGAFGEPTLITWGMGSDYALNEGVFGFHWNPVYKSRRLAGSVSAIGRLREVALFTDARPRATASLGNLPTGWIGWSPDYTLTAGSVALSGALRPGEAARDESMFDRGRHGGRINVAFADGHVTSHPIDPGSLSGVLLLPP